MGFIFYIFGYVASYIAVLFAALSISIGLYYCAELAEEYPSLAGKVIKYSTYGVLALHVILCLDGLPWYESIVGLLAHTAYFQLLRSFPFVEVLSLEAILSAVAFIVSHYVWFHYFISYGYGKPHYDFLTVLGFFFIMLWLIPCGLFISLSINENVLPGIGPSNSAANGINKKTNAFKYVFDLAVSICTPILEKLSGVVGKASKEIMKKFDQNA